MFDALHTLFRSSSLFNFNQVERDRWVRRQAACVRPGSRVLDVGAGSTPYRDAFAHCEYRTQDFSRLPPEQLPLGWYGRIDYVCDAEAIPVPNRSFDVVLCTEMLEHVPQPVQVVRELGRVLRPGGMLILTAPLCSGIHQEPYHYYGGYTPWWYERFLRGAGFEKISIEPNKGSLRFFGQEALRFVRTTSPFGAAFPFGVRLLWFPIWMAVAPLLGIVLPIICRYLDQFDRERRFTVGYHVTAVRTTE